MFEDSDQKDKEPPKNDVIIDPSHDVISQLKELNLILADPGNKNNSHPLSQTY